MYILAREAKRGHAKALRYRWIDFCCTRQQNINGIAYACRRPVVGIRNDPDLVTDGDWAPLGSPQVRSGLVAD